MRPDEQLTPHFALSEFTTSQTAVRFAVPNEPNDAQLLNLRRLALHGEDVRLVLGNVPVLLSSGFRHWVVNGLVKGLISPDQLPYLDHRVDLIRRCKLDTSAHMDGRAFDFCAPRFGAPRDIVALLAANDWLPFDQVIFEGTWVHYAIAREGERPRRQVLTAVFAPGEQPEYLAGLV